MVKPEIFLAAVADPDNTQKHFKETVLSQVPYSDYSQYTDKELGDSVSIWGVQSGGPSESSWRKVSPNDWVLFYTGNSPMNRSPPKTLEYAGEVISTEWNQKITDELWSEFRGSGGLGPESRGPWPCIIYMSEPTEVQIPNDEIRDFADYKENFNPQKFQTYRGNSKIRREFGSIENYISERRI